VRDYENDVPLEAQKYGPLRRIRKRYQEYSNGTPLPRVPIKNLNFDPLRR
jgi:hypothetical protein